MVSMSPSIKKGHGSPISCRKHAVFSLYRDFAFERSTMTNQYAPRSTP